MDLSPYVETVRSGVTNAAALADENTQRVAHQLAGALDASTRLALISALSDAAGEISADLAPSSVQVRMAGQDPEFVVSVSSGGAEPDFLVPPSAYEEAPTDEDVDDDEPVARISLRLPNSVKAKVDEQANREGISTNAWLVRAVMDVLAERSGGRTWGNRGGWGPAADILGPEGPFGPDGVFGPEGPFGAGGPFGNRHRNRGRRDWARRDRPGGSVQGWVQ